MLLSDALPQEHLLLSASKDPEISLHDKRSTKEPLYKLNGHVNPKVQRCSQIYRPTFVAQGGAIATPGQGSKALSLYSVDTGRAISRGHLGYDATMVMWTANRDKSLSVLWVASRHISQLLPLWQPKGETLLGWIVYTVERQDRSQKLPGLSPLWQSTHILHQA
ncbi:hypothetical protein L7F22_036082 [Adiantum nelumboides]|nr:hypothetical protein [Adiantum nelumboides]